MVIATDGCNVMDRHNFLSQKLEAKILSFVSVNTGADPGERLERSPPLKPTKVTLFTMIWYNSENSIRNKTWLQNITEIVTPTLPAGSALVCIVMRTASASYYTAADLDSMGYETAKAL